MSKEGVRLSKTYLMYPLPPLLVLPSPVRQKTEPEKLTEKLQSTESRLDDEPHEAKGAKIEAKNAVADLLERNAQ